MTIEDVAYNIHKDQNLKKCMDKTPRCLILFQNSCKSKITFQTYNTVLDFFLQWSNKDHESFVLLSEFDKNQIMQDYVIHLRKRSESGDLSPNSVPNYLAGVFKFLKVNGCNFNEDSIKQLYPALMKLGGDKAITTEQIKRLLLTCRYKRERALLHFCSATGARPEAISEIQLKHVSKYEEGFLRIVLYVGDTHEMVTFLHPEAVKVLEEYLEWRKSKGKKINSESYLFVTNNVFVKKTSLNRLENMMSRVWKNSDVERVKIGNRYDLAMFTCFRKRFDTALEFSPDVSTGAVQYLMDHTGYLSGKHYRRPEEKQIFNSYKNAVRELMIDDSLRKDYEFEQKHKEFEKHETQKDFRIKELEQRAERTEKLLITLMQKLES
jgi:integrase